MSGERNLCVLVSGGLDSAVALAEARERGPVVPVFVRSGLVWESAEMYWLDRLLQTRADPAIAPLVVLDLPVVDLYGAHWSLTGDRPPGAATGDEAVYLPGRNVLLLAKAGVWAAEHGCRGLFMGPLAANPFPDGTRAFFDAMAMALGLGMGLEGPLPVETPLAGLTKAEVVRRALAAGVPLELTFSCLAPTTGFRHCGTCNKCAERRRGFAAAGIPDPTKYAEPIERTIR